MSVHGEKVRFALKRALESVNPKFGKSCYVRSVSADPINGLMICDCESIEDGSVLEDVRLVADFKDTSNTTGFVLIPKINSIVLVSFLGDSEYYVSMVSDVDSIFLNGNNYEGVVKIVDLVDKLNGLVSELQTQLTLIATGISGAGGTYAPGTLSQFVKTDIENTTVKHGNGTLI